LTLPRLKLQVTNPYEQADIGMGERILYERVFVMQTFESGAGRGFA